MTITLILTLTTTLLFAPAEKTLYIPRPESINPYETIWKVACKIESSNNPLAYHMEENGFPSIGIVQIQESRLIDFNRRFRQSFTLMDMYVPEKAKIVFMAYASDFSPNDYESIFRCWNGGGNGMSKNSTIDYWKKAKSKL